MFQFILTFETQTDDMDDLKLATDLGQRLNKSIGKFAGITLIQFH
jgi:hypothetical protein